MSETEVVAEQGYLDLAGPAGQGRDRLDRSGWKQKIFESKNGPAGLAVALSDPDLACTGAQPQCSGLSLPVHILHVD